MLGLSQIFNATTVLKFDLNCIISDIGACKVSLVRNLGYVYTQNCSELVLNFSELRRSHRHFAHTHPD